MNVLLHNVLFVCVCVKSTFYIFIYSYRWTCCDGAITNFVKDWAEPIVEKFKFQYLVGELIKI